MIKRIRIRNFRSLRKVELEPGPLLNAFVGPNASGKTSFVDALRFLTNLASVGLSKSLSDRGGFGEVFWKGETTEAEIEFDLSVELPIKVDEPSVSAHYTLIVEGSQTGLITVKREKLEVKKGGEFVDVIDIMAGHGTAKHLDGSKAFDPPGNPSISLLEFNIPNWIGSAFKEYLSHTHIYNLIPTAMRQIKPFAKATFLSEYGDNLVEFLTTLKTAHGDSFRQIEQVIKDTFPDLVELIPAPNQAGQVFLTTKEKFLKRPVNVWGMAQGELAFIAFVSLILSPPEFGAPITCVEEPENHLHPRLLEVLIELLRQTEARLIQEGQGPAQIFVTTHSPYLVDRLNLDELIVVEKVEGQTRFSRPREKAELRELLSRERQGLGELWFTGALGGV
jgi:predicted ATPase